jgi:hypothetical protein
VGALAALAALVVGLASCGDDRASDSDQQRYRTNAMVTQRGDSDPELCLQVADHEPPWCSWSIGVRGWSWDEAAGVEVTHTPDEQITWGRYELVGTWDGSALTVLEAEPSTSWPSHQEHSWVQHGTACPEPDGGWFASVDESQLGGAASDVLDAYLAEQPDFVDLWLDSSLHPDFPEFQPGHPTMAEAVLNVRFLDDADRHAEALGEIWGGPLCVTSGGVAVAELEELRARLLNELDDVGAIHLEPVDGYVVVKVPVAEPDQAELDRRYGPGRVRLVAALQPID